MTNYTIVYHKRYSIEVKENNIKHKQNRIKTDKNDPKCIHFTIFSI